MQPNKYSFTKTIPTAIPFDMPDKNGNPLNFIFRLPSADDLEPITKASEEKNVIADKIAKETDEEAIKKLQERDAELDKVSEELMRSLITPVGHNVSFEAALKQTPISVARAVNDMLYKEMGVDRETAE